MLSVADMSRRGRSEETSLTKGHMRGTLCCRPMKIGVRWLWKLDI